MFLQNVNAKLEQRRNWIAENRSKIQKKFQTNEFAKSKIRK